MVGKIIDDLLLKDSKTGSVDKVVPGSIASCQCMSDIFSVTWVSSCNAWTFKFHRHMIRFILTFLALVVGGIGAVAAGVDVFQRRQATGQVPPQCESLCNPINAMLAAVSDIICTAINSHSDFRIAHPLNAAWPLSRLNISIVSSASAVQQM